MSFETTSRKELSKKEIVELLKSGKARVKGEVLPGSQERTPRMKDGKKVQEADPDLTHLYTIKLTIEGLPQGTPVPEAQLYATVDMRDPENKSIQLLIGGFADPSNSVYGYFAEYLNHEGFGPNTASLALIEKAGASVRSQNFPDVDNRAVAKLVYNAAVDALCNRLEEDYPGSKVDRLFAISEGNRISAEFNPGKRFKRVDAVAPATSRDNDSLRLLLIRFMMGAVVKARIKEGKDYYKRMMDLSTAKYAPDLPPLTGLQKPSFVQNNIHPMKLILDNPKPSEEDIMAMKEDLQVVLTRVKKWIFSLEGLLSSPEQPAAQQLLKQLISEIQEYKYPTILPENFPTAQEILQDLKEQREMLLSFDKEFREYLQTEPKLGTVEPKFDLSADVLRMYLFVDDQVAHGADFHVLAKALNDNLMEKGDEFTPEEKQEMLQATLQEMAYRYQNVDNFEILFSDDGGHYNPGLFTSENQWMYEPEKALTNPEQQQQAQRYDCEYIDPETGKKKTLKVYINPNQTEKASGPVKWKRSWLLRDFKKL
jgi:hypothetical protein